MTLTRSLQIPVEKASRSRLQEVDRSDLEFGKYFTDHMLVCDYADDEWQAPAIIPFGDWSLSPVTLALHYGQTIFEGMKAFGMEDGAVNIFRPDKHYQRLTLSAERLCMPVIPQEIFTEGLRQLVELDRAWVPAEAGSALYIRPFMIATEARLRVKVSSKYRFAIVACPVGPYYQQPVRVKVETDFVRAPRGGTGYAKCGGNYGASMYPAQRAREEGYDQVLWTDAKEHRYIEESGAMNVLFVIDGMLVTPPLSDSILDGVTRDSLLRIAVRKGIPVAERPVDIEELKNAFAEGRISEAFGSGTAAVISPIGVIGIDGEDHMLPSPDGSSIGAFLKEALEDIRYGRAEDVESWNFIVN
jgi:branched-chain amino acid aminotransferase